MFKGAAGEQSSNKLSETLIALMGIWLIISPLPDFLVNIFSVGFVDYADSSNNMFSISVVHILTKIGCGLLLIFTRSKLVTFLGLQIDSSSDSKTLVSASLFLLGIYLLLNGCVALGQHYATSHATNFSNPSLLW